MFMNVAAPRPLYLKPNFTWVFEFPKMFRTLLRGYTEISLVILFFSEQLDLENVPEKVSLFLITNCTNVQWVQPEGRKEFVAFIILGNRDILSQCNG